MTDQPIAAAIHSHTATSGFGNIYQFTARRFDEATGLYYNRRRYYEPRSGRFLSRDPLGYQDGLNAYAYAQNNPVNFLDPLGQKKAPPVPRTYRRKRRTYTTYVDKIKGTASPGRTQVFYGVSIYCDCHDDKSWHMTIKYVVDYRIQLLKKLLQETAPRRRGIYGHEWSHIRSIEEQVRRHHKQLVKEIKRLAKQGYGKKDLCVAQIKNARSTLEKMLAGIISKGAGHDPKPNPKTTKPAEGELIKPPGGQGPGTSDAARKAMDEGWDKAQKDMHKRLKEVSKTGEGLIYRRYGA